MFYCVSVFSRSEFQERRELRMKMKRERIFYGKAFPV
jgi:hypothetical protein